MRQRHSDSLIVQAPAKINLFLELLGKREDGFHDLETVMAAINLYDTLRFQTQHDGQIKLKGRFDLPARYCEEITVATDRKSFWGKKNLVYRAAHLIKQNYSVEQGVSIELVKRIPSAAGLGGASSDAAATILALNDFWSLGLNQEEMTGLAAQLGSDIPFFIHSNAAICRGRGEIVESLSSFAPIFVVVCKPPVGLSTACVFAKCKMGHAIRKSKLLLAGLRTGNVNRIAANLFNRLEEFAEPLSSEIRQMNYRFSQVGSLGHQLSGSGTSYFGLFANHKTALRAANRLACWLPTSFLFVGRTLAPRGS